MIPQRCLCPHSHTYHGMIPAIGYETTYMDKKKPIEQDDQAGGITDKKDKNAGSGAFNQGSAQDPDMDRGASDDTPDPEKASREEQNPKATDPKK